MILEEVQERYGVYLAELIRQALTLRDFNNLALEDLVLYFEQRSEKHYEEYRSKQKLLPPENGPIETQNEYLEILRRRWQEAEDMAYMVLKAEKDACDREAIAIEA